MKKESEIILVVIAFLIALGFRLAGMEWGLPYPYDNDGFCIISRAVNFFGGNFNPQWFIYPSFHMYLLFFVYLGIYGIGYLRGVFSSVYEFRSLLDIDPSLFIISARVVAVILASGSVVLCYILAKRLFGRKVALLSLLFAVLPMEVLNSHYCTSDIPLVFWFLLTFIFCAGIMAKPDLRYYILAGVFTGIAGGTKYPGLGGILPITVAHLVRLYRLEKKWRPTLLSKENYKLIIALGIIALAFFASTPYVFLDYQHSVPNIIGEFKIRYTSTFDIYQRQNEPQMFVYVKETFLNFGYLFMLLGLFGIVKSRSSNIGERLLLLSWIVPFAVIIHISALKPPRYFLLVSPFLFIFLADAIIRLKERYLEKFTWSKFAALFIILLIPVQPIYYSVKNNIILTRPDTRQRAHDWVIENIPEGTVIAKEFLWAPFLPKNRYKIIYDNWSLGDNAMAWYKERNVEYFLVSENMKDLMSAPDRPSPLHRRFYKDLEENASLIRRVNATDKGLFMDFHNSTVLIYKMKRLDN